MEMASGKIAGEALTSNLSTYLEGDPPSLIRLFNNWYFTTLVCVV